MTRKLLSHHLAPSEGNPPITGWILQTKSPQCGALMVSLHVSLKGHGDSYCSINTMKWKVFLQCLQWRQCNVAAHWTRLFQCIENHEPQRGMQKLRTFQVSFLPIYALEKEGNLSISSDSNSFYIPNWGDCMMIENVAGLWRTEHDGLLVKYIYWQTWNISINVWNMKNRTKDT